MNKKLIALFVLSFVSMQVMKASDDWRWEDDFVSKDQFEIVELESKDDCKDLYTQAYIREIFQSYEHQELISQVMVAKEKDIHWDKYAIVSHGTIIGLFCPMEHDKFKCLPRNDGNVLFTLSNPINSENVRNLTDFQNPVVESKVALGKPRYDYPGQNTK